MKKRLGRILAVLTGIYLAGGVILYFIQDKLLFHPRSLPPDHRFSFDQPFEEINHSFLGNNISMLKFRAEGKRKGLVLFFHGNMENMEHYRQYPQIFTRNGYECWMLDYPGFGKTTGKRSESLIYAQAEEFYFFASKNIRSDSLVIYGKSIGTGIAAYIAARHPCRRLVLETPYYSVDALAKHYFPIYPVMPMTEYSFPIFTYLQSQKAPLLMLHGTEDEVIPYRQAQRLREENPRATLISIEGGKHNDLAGFPLFNKTIDSLLSD